MTETDPSLFFHTRHPGAPPLRTHILVGLAAVPPPQYNGCPGIQLWQRCLTRGAVPYIMMCRCPAPPEQKSKRRGRISQGPPTQRRALINGSSSGVAASALSRCVFVSFWFSFSVVVWLCYIAFFLGDMEGLHMHFYFCFILTECIWCGWISNDIRILTILL